MYMDREKYDWGTREDADTIQRYQRITKDKDRMIKATSCIVDSINQGKEALGLATSPAQPSRRNNPAKVGKLPQF